MNFSTFEDYAVIKFPLLNFNDHDNISAIRKTVGSTEYRKPNIGNKQERAGR